MDAPAARQELLLTIEGMQCVRLGLATDAQVSPPPYCRSVSAQSDESIPASHAMVLLLSICEAVLSLASSSHVLLGTLSIHCRCLLHLLGFT